MATRPLAKTKRPLLPVRTAQKASSHPNNKHLSGTNIQSILDKVSAQLFVGISLAISGIFLYSWRLTNLTLYKASAAELATNHHLLAMPWYLSIISLNGPYYLLLHLFNLLSNSLTAFRMLSVVFGIISGSLIYWLVSNWHGYKIGLLTGVCSLTSFGFLIASRQATTLISQLLAVSALIFVLQLIDERPNLTSLGCFLFVLTTTLYLPGGIWLSLTSLCLSLPKLPTAWRSIKNRQKTLFVFLTLTFITPLVYLLVRHFSISLIKQWLGLNINKPIQAAHNLVTNISDLFFRNTQPGSSLSLGHNSLLPFAISLLALIGIIYYFRHLSVYRWRNLAILLIICLLTSSLGQISILASLPLIIISVGTGLAFLLKDWYRVFPRNPVARNSALAIVSIVILFVAFYSLRSYFVAWAYNPAAQDAYTKQLR